MSSATRASGLAAPSAWAPCPVGSPSRSRPSSRSRIESPLASAPSPIRRPPVPRPGRLDGRACLIVGGTSGIGLASARRFLEEGARAVISGRSAESASEALARLAPLGPVWAVEADVTRPGAVVELFAATREHLGGRLDVLFHVAGRSGRGLGD